MDKRRHFISMSICLSFINFMNSKNSSKSLVNIKNTDFNVYVGEKNFTIHNIILKKTNQHFFLFVYMDQRLKCKIQIHKPGR